MKNLENEYKDYMTAEASKVDAEALWNKIEAALPEKNITPPKDNHTVSITTHKKWYKNTKLVPMAGTLVAACLLLVLLLPGIANVKNNTTGDKTAANHKTESALFNTVQAEDSAAIYYEEETADYSENYSTEPSDNSAEIASDAPQGLEEEKENGFYDKSEESLTSKVQMNSNITRFIVLSINEDTYRCRVLASNAIFSEDDEFILYKEDGVILEVSEEYSYELTEEASNYELLAFSIKK